MYTKITGRLLAVTDDAATIAAPPFEYQVQIPDFARRQLQTSIGETVSLHTLHYLEGNPTQGRLMPRLVGFTSDVEREFFELFCSVDGVGMRKALRAMVRPVRDVASLIEHQDAKGLSALPGIGPATSERVIAKLRRKMPKFALMVDERQAYGDDVEQDLAKEVFQILCHLGHGEADAHKMLEATLSGRKKYKDVDTLLQAVYQTSQEA